MKIRYTLLTLLFAALSTTLFAQITTQDFYRKIEHCKIPHKIPDANHNLYGPINDNVHPFGKSRMNNASQNAFMQEGEWRRNIQNTNEQRYVCDSAFTYSTNGNQIKTIFFRDVPGRLMIEFSQMRNSEYTAIWANRSQIIYSYNALGNYSSVINQEWDYQNAAWINAEKSSFSYDNAGNILSNVWQEWDTRFGDWVSIRREVYTMDDAGNVLTNLQQDWDKGISDWINRRKSSYSYDVAGNMLTWQEQYWDAGINNWINFHLYSYTYDVARNMLSLERKSWDSKVVDWVKMSLFIYSYDVSGNMLVELYQIWESKIREWVNHQKYILSYDIAGNNYAKHHQMWVTGVDKWVNTFLDSFTYDDSGNLLSELIQYWDDRIEVWKNIQKASYEYDYNIKKVIGKSYHSSLDGWVSADGYLPFIIYDNYLFTGYFSFKAEAYYSSYTLGIEDKDVQAIDKTSFCSPNPAKDLVNVTNFFSKEASLKIYTMNGQLLNEKLLSSGQNQVSIQNLSPGIYLFVLQSENLRIQNKVVVY